MDFKQRLEKNKMDINPKVIDISHYDRLVGGGFQDVRKAGIIGVIHKSSEGIGIVDHPYSARRPLAKEAGLLWGAYHFIRPGDMISQAEFFLIAAQPDDHTLVSLDFEVDNVSVDECKQFAEHCELRIGRKIVLYTGHTIKEDLGNKIDAWWGARRLWLAQYTTKPVVQRSWSKYWLWQYTGDGLGPIPHKIPGIQIAGGLDISHYDGSDEQLMKEWANDQEVDKPKIFEEGIASWYDDSETASGEPFRSDLLKAAHKTLPFGTKVKVTREDNNKSIVVTINDRGPFVHGRIIDLTFAGAVALGIASDPETEEDEGLTKVKLEI